MGHKYNYVLLNGYDGFNNPSYNENGYYSICMRDLWDDKGILISNCPMDYTNAPLRLICSIYNHPKIRLPFQKLWYPFFIKGKFESTKPYCFISIGFKWPINYYKWIKKQYPDSIIVRFVRDLVSTQKWWYDSLKDSGVVDYWITYDEEEAQKYGMLYHNEVESKIDLPYDNPILYDVFFAGRAKKRLSRIVEVYDVLEKAGLKCHFYITGAKPQNQMCRDGIVYSDNILTYKEMLELNMKSRCLLEINQEGAVGYTSRFLEAVMYNKLLLTDNMCIKNTPYYNCNYIQCFKDPGAINTSFISKPANVDFKYKDEFSPKHFIDFLDKL